MKIFIRSASCISPQQTFKQELFLPELVNYTANYLKVIQPDYATILDPKLLRRMSYIVKMGVAAAITSLQEGGITEPGAIITGTAYGCLEDTGIFLNALIKQDEETLSPTAFIQSTHNTVGAQIALMLKCNAYNNTFVHTGFSFENALLDGMMLLQEGEINNVLAGAVDEITNTSLAILNRFKLYKEVPVSNLSLFDSPSKGTIAGEGAAFFVLSSQRPENAYAQIDGLATFYKPASEADVKKNIADFVASHALDLNDIDLVIAGRNGDMQNDGLFDSLQNSIFANNAVINYKHLCGEYPTASSFAMWLAAKILQAGQLPKMPGNHTGKQIKKILVYNTYLGIHHSLILLTDVE